MSVSSMTPFHPFLPLPPAEQLEISKKVQADFKKKGIQGQAFGKCYKLALEAMKGNVQIDATVLSIVDALNQEADKKIEEKQVITSWDNEWGDVCDLGWYLKIGFGVSEAVSVFPAGLALVYLRSHKVIAIANMCVACATGMFGILCLQMSRAFERKASIIEELGHTKNFQQFSAQVEGSYQELKKTSWVMRLYFNAHEKNMKKESVGLQLLREQLSAFHHFKNLLERLCWAPTLFSASESPDFSIIKKFFEKIEKFSSLAKKGAIGLGMLALAWSYYAASRKAYLMVVTGVTGAIGTGILTQQLFVLQRGAKKIYSAKEGEIDSAYQEMAPQLFLLRRMGLEKAGGVQIHNAVVIPFSAILNLIPSWKVK